MPQQVQEITVPRAPTAPRTAIPAIDKPGIPD